MFTLFQSVKLKIRFCLYKVYVDFDRALDYANVDTSFVFNTFNAAEFSIAASSLPRHFECVLRLLPRLSLCYLVIVPMWQLYIFFILIFLFRNSNNSLVRLYKDFINSQILPEISRIWLIKKEYRIELSRTWQFDDWYDKRNILYLAFSRWKPRTRYLVFGI